MSKIYLYNSLTKTQQEFLPVTPGKVKIYACGVTTYDHPHLGHARSAIVSDILCKTLEASGLKVFFVKNFTDIDDKVIERSLATKTAWQKLSCDMIKSHDKDMQDLNISPPNLTPKATEHIPEMIEMIKGLLNKGFAYEIAGDVFFKTDKFSQYGKLSGKKTDDLIAGARVEINHKKLNPLDFSLWKKTKDQEPHFESPWGKGRPGWHIECSAMSLKHLGERFDIHVGGSDLIFPHHDNEIAQSEAFLDHPQVNYWLHHEMVRVDGQKMSKSLKNFFTVKDLLKIYNPELIRFYLSSTHYRKVIDFRKDLVLASCEGLDRLYRSLGSSFDAKTPTDNKELARLKDDFLKELALDLNTPKAISMLFNLSKDINKTNKKAVSELLKSAIYQAGRILGIFNFNPQTWLKTPRVLTCEYLDDKQVKSYLKKRALARQNKDWQLSDNIRELLLNNKIKITDNKDNSTSWQRIN